MEIDVMAYLSSLEKQLFAQNNRKKISLNKDWPKSLNLNVPGVYVFFENNNPCYVGETGSLSKRMNDIRNTKHHSLRRSFGTNHFKENVNWSKPSSYVSFHPEIESELNFLIEKSLQVSLLPVELGRKELEEHICSKYNLLDKYNNRGQRK
ncbi:hypothetical protein MTsPCn9_34700 [Croceitalea sp. MTPC9]|uniref:GIY-YIG nuclease family protein n=1 Tax=unclassified Croceitalea TaxID=2632280 RepID=UPI002B3E1DEA|nr:hypothetical protein MTsPCn6_35450 [Croceitalea sp. MTPC6]GMN18530.1 hypothetical protein MTsPCn9_34700 [Croceitalea sp. MTPC9]